MPHYLSLLILLPLAAAVVVCVLPIRGGLLLARAVVVAGVALSCPLWMWYRPTSPDLQLSEHVGVLSRVGIDYYVGLDGIGLLFVLASGVAAVVAAWLLAPAADAGRGGPAAWLLGAYALVLTSVLAADARLFVASWLVAVLCAAIASRRAGARFTPEALGPFALVMVAWLAATAGVGVLRFALPTLVSSWPFMVRVGIWGVGAAVPFAILASVGRGWVGRGLWLSLALATGAVGAFFSMTPVGLGLGVRVLLGQLLLVSALALTGAFAAGRARRDVSRAALVVSGALVVLAMLVGVGRGPVDTVLRVPVLKLAASMDARYQGEFVAACDTTVTPEMKAASPAAQFLAAAPCGPDGKPLPGR